MGDLLYRFVSAGLQAFIWGGDIIDEENLPERGPAILVSNHLDALGPIAVVAGIPRRLYPWIAAEMLDPQRAAEYLRLDFIEKEFGLRLPVSLWLAKALSKITVPLLRSAGCVPVHAETDELHSTFEDSLELLLQGHLLLIFPEDPARPFNPRFNMLPFKKGFIRLAELYFQQTSRVIRFYPIAVYAQRNLIQVGKPVRYNPYASPAGERLRIKSVLETMIHDLYLELGGKPYAGIPLPH